MEHSKEEEEQRENAVANAAEVDGPKVKNQTRSFSIKLWPPSENTRQMLVVRITDNLTAKSIFTQKYGSLTKEEAEVNAKKIEEAAFATASQLYETEPDGDGGSAVQLYAKDCSKQILEVLKKGPSKMEEKVETIATHEATFDISKGPRSFIEAKEAEELLSSLKQPGNSYTKVCFSNRSFGIEAARVAAPILKTMKAQIKEVDLSDFIAGRPEGEALEVINIFANALQGSILRCLDLSNNALGEKGVRAFSSLLETQADLEELYLMNDGISEEAAKAVSELIPATKNLKILHFHNNMTGDKGASAIAEIVKASPLLEDFRCSSTRVGASGGIALSESLEFCANLKKLDLRDNMFGVEAAHALSKSLRSHSCLVELYLSYLNLEDEGALAILAALTDSAPSLEVLDMAGNDITSEAAPSLAACVSQKRRLVKLNMAENELKDEGMLHISRALSDGHDCIREVDVNTNAVGRSGARVLSQMLVGMPEFTMLNINGNFISDEGVEELKEIFRHCPEKLGSLDENDPEGGQDDDEEGEEEQDDGDVENSAQLELESKLKNLQVEEDD